MNHPVVPLRHLLVLHDAGVWGPEDRASGIGVLRSINFNRDGSIRFDNVSLRDIEPRKRVSKKLLPNDIILEKSGGGPKQPVGRVCLYRGHHDEHAFGNFTTRLRVDRSTVNPEYLFWCLRHLHTSGGTEQYQKHTSGIRNLETKRYLEHPIHLPPLDEQRWIVDILNRAARIEALRSEAAERLREFLPALFVKMFGDPVTNPMEWHSEKLSSLGTLDRGRSRYRPRNAPHLFGGRHPFVQTGDIANSQGLVTRYSQTYSDAGLNQSRMWPSGTLCITIAANIAMTGILTFDSCFPDSIVGFQPGQAATVEYVQATIDLMQKRLEEGAPRAAQRNINLGVLRNLTIPTPPLDLQRRFSDIVDAARAYAHVGKASSSTTASLTASLASSFLQDAVSERAANRR